MSIPKLVITAFALLLFHCSLAQPICGFDLVHGKRMKEDSNYRLDVHRIESNLRKYIQLHNLKQSKGPTVLSGPPYNIPVVVHVVHTGGAVGTIYNPTDGVIQGAIDYLNQIYNGSYPGLAGAGDLGIQFALAKRDPNCNATNGINRVDGSAIVGYAANGVSVSGGPGTNEINIKNLIRWDPSQYYNIWVVDKLNGNDGTSGSFIAGFAYFPGGNPNYDGTIMLATQMLSGQKTLPHEIGHAFNLYHPFEGSPDKNTCPANADCNADGDQVCDTDPITYNQLAGAIDFSCRSGINSCNGIAYSSNTESNFMNYTNCYNLFTIGQRARMQASAAGADRITLSNSLGALAPASGPTPCVPKINFESAGDQQTESTISSSGCRNYKDYSYNMVIGTGPSATATATLKVISGSAIEGVDFDLTTNGSFSSPSKSLTFPAGSIALQSFTVRVYDDASVESVEQFALGFTVNPGTGDATTGDGLTSFTMIIDDNDVAPTAGVLPSGIAVVGTAGSTLGAGPFDATQQSQKIQFEYKASELSAAGIPPGYISSIALFVQTKLSTRSFTGLSIKIGTTAASYLVNGMTVTTGSSMTIVKTMSDYTTIAGWNDFTFDVPYIWDGTSNLVVEFCYDNGTIAAGAGIDLLSSFLDGGTSTQGSFIVQNGISCGQSFSAVSFYQSGRKPIARFVYGIAETTVQTILNSSKQEYLGPNADIYFYDQASNHLMARIQNGNFDYGCTEVQIDRAGSAATAFWNNNTANYLMDKTFRVLPSVNNSSGDYTITLYYTQAEVNGWQTFTGQSVSNIQLVKATNPIASVTPASPGAGGTIASGNAIVSSLGTNTGLTYHFTTGFSGFGAGVVGIILPIHGLNFEVEMKNGHIQLNWQTSSEENSRGFDVERSYDGTLFDQIGFLAAAGNSSYEKNYTFTDTDKPAADNYYRLKEWDLDNHFQYSPVRWVHLAKSQNRFIVLNNPFINSIDIQWNKSFRGIAVARLLDITGKELCRSSFDTNSGTGIRIDLSGKTISAGVYLLEITLNNERQVERVIKQ